MWSYRINVNWEKADKSSKKADWCEAWAGVAAMTAARPVASLRISMGGGQLV